MKFITIKNNLNMEVTLSTIGAGIVDIKVPDRNQVIESVVAHPRGEKYAFATSYFGKTCGRTGGRITKGKFKLDGNEYHIKTLDPNALHGGVEGVSYKEFSYEFKEENNKKVIFTYFSKDNEGGYPGNMRLMVSYSLELDENTLSISYDAICDKKTLCNITNHTYFNLSGDVKADVLNHNLYINASKYAPIVDAIPASIDEVNEVFDFRDFHQIGKYIKSPLLTNTNGYDHPYVFDSEDINKPCAILYDELSGRRMEMYTTYEALVCYTCNYPENVLLPNGNRLKKNDAVCLELQHFPNGVNSDFLNDKRDILNKNKHYYEKIILKFTV